MKNMDMKSVVTSFVIGIPVGLVFGYMITILTENYVYLWAAGIPLGIIFGIILAVPMAKGKNRSAKEIMKHEEDKKD
ncbi:hypothetical protein [Salinicoccus sp. HZC-1]|uniref:hypothetical protein n=1 Tax=Salinicoccus sp. HZC-1 TaxID=3385497 RepID=UPI00398B0E24